MASRNYQIIIRSSITGDIITIVPQTEMFTMRYSIETNAVGKFAMTLPATQNWDELIALDSQLEVWREDDGGILALDAIYFARAMDKFREDASERVVIGGLHANHLLERRIIDPDDDSNASGGYSTKAGNGGDVIREYVREQAADLASEQRQFPEFSVPSPLNVGSTIGATYRYENLLESMQKLALKAGIEFEVRRNDTIGGKALKLVIGNLGEDKTVTTNNFPPYLVFNPNYGNLESPKLSDDRSKEVSFIYILGDGEGVNRTVLKVPSNYTTDSPYNRIEKQHDGRSADKGSGVIALLTEAVATLDANRPKRQLDFKVIAENGGARYKTDWNLSDKVTVIWNDFQADLQITKVEFTVEGLRETILPEVTFLS